MIGTALKILKRVETNDAARGGARGAAGSLRGGGFAYPPNFERWKSSPRRVARDARQAAVDYRGYAFNGDGAFRDIGGQNHFSLARRRYRAILFRGREIAVQRGNQKVVLRRQRLAFTGSAPDFGRSGQENQNVTRVLLVEKIFNRSSRLLFERQCRVGLMRDRKIEKAALGSKNRATTQVLSDGRRGQRCRHDNNSQIRPHRGLEPAKQGQCQIALEMTLVKLIQDNSVHSGEFRIRDQPACEDAFGQETKAGASARDFFKANLIPNGFSQPLATLLGYSAGGHSRGDSARFQHQHLAWNLR